MYARSVLHARRSAYHHLRVITQMCGMQPLLYITAAGRVEPLYSFPVVKQSEIGPGAMQLTADLMALTPDEFALKYEPFRVGHPETVELDLDQLRGWADGKG